MTDKHRPSLMQRLHLATGDREKETEELAKDTRDAGAAADGATDDDIHAAAQQAVRNAHGDPGVEATHEVEGDVATPADVERATSDASNPAKPT